MTSDLPGLVQKVKGLNSFYGPSPDRGNTTIYLVLSGVRVARSLVFYIMYCMSLFVILCLTIVLSVLLRFVVDVFPFSDLEEVSWSFRQNQIFWLHLWFINDMSLGHAFTQNALNWIKNTNVKIFIFSVKFNSETVRNTEIRCNTTM